MNKKVDDSFLFEVFKLLGMILVAFSLFGFIALFMAMTPVTEDECNSLPGLYWSDFEDRCRSGEAPAAFVEQNEVRETIITNKIPELGVADVKITEFVPTFTPRLN